MNVILTPPKLKIYRYIYVYTYMSIYSCFMIPLEQITTYNGPWTIYNFSEKQHIGIPFFLIFSCHLLFNTFKTKC